MDDAKFCEVCFSGLMVVQDDVGGKMEMEMCIDMICL